MTDLRTWSRNFVDKYLPLSGSVGGFFAGTAFIDISVKTGNGWFLLAGLFLFFYAVFYYRWVTTKSERRKEDGA